MRERGFSLVEVTVVLAILAIAAGVVVFRMHAPRQAVTMRDVVGRLAWLDRAARVYAREHDRSLRIAIDSSAGRLRRMDAGDGRPVGAAVTLPQGWRVGSVRIGPGDASGALASIAVSRLGLTPAYALRIDGPEGQRQWLLVAGLTGEVTLLDDERHVLDILAAVRHGHDAR